MYFNSYNLKNCTYNINHNWKQNKTCDITHPIIRLHIKHIFEQWFEYYWIDMYYIDNEARSSKGIDYLTGEPQLQVVKEETDSTCEGKQRVVGYQSIKVESKKLDIGNIECNHHTHEAEIRKEVFVLIRKIYNNTCIKFLEMIHRKPVATVRESERC